MQFEVSKNNCWHVGACLAPELIEEQQTVLHLDDDAGPQGDSTPVLLLIAGKAATSLCWCHLSANALLELCSMGGLRQLTESA